VKSFENYRLQTNRHTELTEIINNATSWVAKKLLYVNILTEGDLTSDLIGFNSCLLYYRIQILFASTDLYKYSPDAVPPIHAVSYHVATDKPPAQKGDKFRSIFSDDLQPIATRGKKARGTLLVDKD